MGAPLGHTLVATERVHPRPDTSALDGEILVEPAKALWVIGHFLGMCTAILAFPSVEGAIVFLALTALTICAGHSVGMHRLLIHRSFRTPRWLEYILVWLGTLVGMAGPFGMIQTHDLRDWHQRQADCPPHPAHSANFWRDAWWQLCCRFRLKSPPDVMIEEDVRGDLVYRAMEKTWLLQQVPLAVGLYAIGGWGWVFWGICARVFTSLFGHWLVGHFAHPTRDVRACTTGLTVHGQNLPGLSWLAFGENWHGNHHAHPTSAKLGIDPGQFDPGFLFIRVLQMLGLAWDICLPGEARTITESQPARSTKFRSATQMGNPPMN